ncbi:hypothetical protein [Halobacillus yeomjeoni]|uniref:Uncharacterized protein n=1 Tax=Halobacillus yeomjeoni TaxID=311194 RepID=A0A931HVU8_9BACI|nr:hypothetical protein [Halobacillus yeomjeoni]MBH0230484.1 hypothetical protein [Halobacillus yeomjeoni]
MDSKKLKDAVNRKISDKPLYTEEDRRRFYSKTKKNKLWSIKVPALPHILTLLLILLLVGGATVFLNGTSSPFQSANDPVSDENGVGENPSEQGEVNIAQKVKEIKGTFSYQLNVEEAETTFNSNSSLTYMKKNPVTGVETLTSEFMYYDGESFVHKEDMTLTGKDYKEGKPALSFEITWGADKQADSAILVYYSEAEGRVVEEKFTSDGFIYDVDGEKIQIKNHLQMQELVLEAIGESIGKNSKPITEKDLSLVKELTIDGSEFHGIYDIKGKAEHFSMMENLEHLTLKQAAIPPELLKEIPNLRKVTFRGPSIMDLSSVSEGLQKITHINIKNSSFRGNAEDLMTLQNLKVVILDKSNVPDWKRLEEAGIEVREK